MHARLFTPLPTLLATLALAVSVGACDDDAAAPCDPAAGVCTWAGVGEAAFDGDGLALADSMFYWPIDLTFTASGDAYILDWNNHRVRKVTPAGTLQTVIGNDEIGDGPADLSDKTLPGAPGPEVTLNHPTQMLEMPDGTLILLAWHNHKLRVYDPDTGLVHVMCGGAAGFGGDGGPVAGAVLNQPQSAAVTADGDIYFLDQRNQAIRRLGADGVVTTVAGVPTQAGFAGDGGDPLQAKFNFPAGSNPPPAGGVALDADGRLYVGDTLNHRVRVIDFAANTIDTIAGTGTPGYSGDGGPGDQAQVNNPRNLEVGPDGALYIGDELNHRIRRVDLATGVITTAVGTGEAGYNGDGLPARETSLNRPVGVEFDAAGDMFVLDTYNHRIRHLAAGTW